MVCVFFVSNSSHHKKTMSPTTQMLQFSSNAIQIESLYRRADIKIWPSHVIFSAAKNLLQYEYRFRRDPSPPPHRMPTEEDIGNLPFSHDAEARRSTPTPSRPFPPTRNKTRIRGRVPASKQPPAALLQQRHVRASSTLGLRSS